jgi:hypothetical protein
LLGSPDFAAGENAAAAADDDDDDDTPPASLSLEKRPPKKELDASRTLRRLEPSKAAMLLSALFEVEEGRYQGDFAACWQH